MMKRNECGFSLVELLIAISIMAVFLISFSISHQGQIFRSQDISDEVELTDQCYIKMQEALLTLTPLSEPMTVAPIKVQDPKFPDLDISYQWSLFIIPDLNGSGGESSQSDSQSNENNFDENFSIGQAVGATANDAQSQMAMQQIFIQVQENFKKLLYQLKVTIVSKDTKKNCELSTWVINPGQRIEFNAF
jgi:prepilin-type N-terminal cleavage/methylation domain-containing protein